MGSFAPWWHVGFWSLVTKCPTESRTGAVVATGKVIWRPAVPVPIERDIPRKTTRELDVVGCVRVELHAARIGDDGQEHCVKGAIGFVESEELQIGRDQTRRQVLGNDILLILRVPFGKAGKHRNASPVTVLQKASDATIKGGLMDYSLLRALQDDTKALIEPIVPAQQTVNVKVQLVPGRNSSPVLEDKVELKLAPAAHHSGGYGGLLRLVRTTRQPRAFDTTQTKRVCPN